MTPSPWQIEMPLVEGFGDEVVFLLIAFLVGVIVVLAWMSTHVGSRFLVPIIILDQERFSALIHRLRGFAEQRVNEQQRRESGAPPRAESRPEDETVARRDVETDSQITGPDSSSRENRDNPAAQSSRMTDLPSTSSADNTSESPSPPCTDSIAETPAPKIPGTPVSDGDPSSSGHSERSGVNSPSVPEDSVQIRLQYIDGRQRMVSAKLDDTVGAFKR